MAPVIAPLLQVLSRAGIDLAVIPAALRPLVTGLYAVTGEGEFGGRRYVAGEVLVCRGEPAGTEPVVLAPKGPGRPMLGRAVGEALTGDAGEPCAADRWTVAGRVERVLLAAGPIADACARFGRASRVRPTVVGAIGSGRVERAGVDGRGAVGARSLGAAAAVRGTPRPSPVPEPIRGARTAPAGQLVLFGRAA